MRRYSQFDKIPRGNASNELTDGCLVLEGGAFRGLYTQGVLDCFMMNNLNFSCVVGVSAGALGGMNYVSGQIGRSARANLGYRHDGNYIGLSAIKKSHSVIRLDFLFDEFNRLEPLDETRFYDTARRFAVVATDCQTGKTKYFEKGIQSDFLRAIKASASMPFVSPTVSIDGTPYLDGGCSCKIPYRWAVENGFSKIVVVKTREHGFRSKAHEIRAADEFYKKYPEFAKSLKASNITYNRECDGVDKLRSSGRIFVIEPSKRVDVKAVEPNVEKLGSLYWLGYNDANKSLQKLNKFLSDGGRPVRLERQ